MVLPTVTGWHCPDWHVVIPATPSPVAAIQAWAAGDQAVCHRSLPESRHATSGFVWQRRQRSASQTGSGQCGSAEALKPTSQADSPLCHPLPAVPGASHLSPLTPFPLCYRRTLPQAAGRLVGGPCMKPEHRPALENQLYCENKGCLLAQGLRGAGAPLCRVLSRWGSEGRGQGGGWGGHDVAGCKVVGTHTLGSLASGRVGTLACVFIF